VLPSLVPVFERHRHLKIEPVLKQKLLQASPAKIEMIKALRRANSAPTQ